MNYNDVKKSLEILNLSEDITFSEIKKRFRKLSKKYHPDLCKEKEEICKEQMDKIKKAYDILEEYCKNFRFSFSEEEFYEQYPEEKVKDHYYNTGLWGRKD